MSKQKKKKHNKKRNSIMGRSDIPFAERLKMQQHSDIISQRNYSAQIAMFCQCVALNELEHVGYKRLTKFSVSFKYLLDEMYEDIEVGMAHAKTRLAKHGINISGELYAVAMPGASKKDQQLYDHGIQAAQIAQIVGTVTMNDEFGFGEVRLKRVLDRSAELSAQYAKKGEGFLYEKLEKIGFPIIDGNIIAFMDDNGNPVPPKRAIEEGYLDAVN